LTALVMMFSEYEKHQMVYYWKKGYKAPTIAKLLQIEGIRRGIHKLIRTALIRCNVLVHSCA